VQVMNQCRRVWERRRGENGLLRHSRRFFSSLGPGLIFFWENLKNDPPNFRICKNDPVLDGPATVFAFCRAHLELCIKSWIHIKDCIETYLELSGLLISMKIGQVITSHPIWP
jgi:hypothetical protein